MMNRRGFVALAGSCAAHLALGAVTGGRLAAQAAARTSRPVVADEPWGRLEQVADGVWALVSTPLSGASNARLTLSNGGIVAGRSGVAIIEAFASEAGARWMAGEARRLTGRGVSHAILTHFHGDHAAGLAGYRDGTSGPIYVTTSETRGRLRTPAAIEALEGAHLVDLDAPMAIDLGGRRLAVTPRAGHTSSDLSVLVDDPAVMFGGDLLWNRYFPNYVDAVPSVLSRQVRALAAERAVVRIPGHGPIFDADDLTHYIGVIDLVEEAALKARAAGTPAAEAARAIVLPASLGQWTLFNQNYFEVALRAFEREASSAGY